MSGKPLPGEKAIGVAQNWLNELLKNPWASMGSGEQTAQQMIETVILPALPDQSKNYYGFVTGSVTPAARRAEIAGALADANAAASLPKETITVRVEDTALQLLLDFLDLERHEWPGRIFTTGATASNLLGMAIARQYVVGSDSDVANLGLFKAMKNGGISDIKVFSCMCHSSLVKTLSIVGLGRSSIVDCGKKSAPWDFDLNKLENEMELLASQGGKAIVTANFGEVNTGGFTENIPTIRKLCDKYGAWLHIDGAFAAYLRLLARPGSDSKYKKLAWKLTRNLELADSITFDAHKTLNVPYDCGVFYTKHAPLMQQVFQNGNAAYLNTSDGAFSNEVTSSGLEYSPMNSGIENSRRFRALPVLATLVAYGSSGYQKFLESIIETSRQVADYLDKSPDFELLVPMEIVNTIVIFRARDDHTNQGLAQKINSLNMIYVSPSAWDGKPAVRIAPCSWYLEPAKDVHRIVQALQALIQA